MGKVGVRTRAHERCFLIHALPPGLRHSLLGGSCEQGMINGVADSSD